MKGTYVTQYLDTNLLWDVVKDRQAQIIQVASIANPISPPSGHAFGSYNRVPVNTSPDTAFEVIALGLLAYYVPTLIATTGTGTAVTTNAMAVNVTYDQPSPPASNTTTAASTSGNLEFRNRFTQMQLIVTNDFINYGSASTGITNSSINVHAERTLVLGNPIRFVGTNLEVGYSQNSYSEQSQLFVDCWVVGRYVPISPSEYVNLVALATGQAILPPSILG